MPGQPGTVALVTGAAQGLGQATALRVKGDYSRALELFQTGYREATAIAAS